MKSLLCFEDEKMTFVHWEGPLTISVGRIIKCSLCGCHRVKQFNKQFDAL